jgi:hypothetical protein
MNFIIRIGTLPASRFERILRWLRAGALPGFTLAGAVM